MESGALPSLPPFGHPLLHPMEERAGERRAFIRLAIANQPPIIGHMNRTQNARRLRRDQTEEEKQLWRALRAGRFVGFKFRRQHPAGMYFLDFYCPAARLAVELDGFQHGVPGQMQHDEERERFLAGQEIELLRFWNHQWRDNRDGVLLDIWHALHRRTGCVKLLRKVQNHRFVPPVPGQFVGKPPKPATWHPRESEGGPPLPDPLLPRREEREKRRGVRP